MIIEEASLRNRPFVFRDRTEGGKWLAGSLVDYADSDAIVLAIPVGGIPVAKEISGILALRFDLVIVRKIQIPWTSEAGFGAVNLDGSVMMNEQVLNSLYLSEEVIDSQVKKALKNVRNRNTLFRGGKRFPSVKGKTVILVDDGLASGYTMLAAIDFIKKRHCRELFAAAPTGFYETIRMIEPSVDRIYCPNIREEYPFAVSEAYRDWNDLSDAEALEALREINQKT